MESGVDAGETSTSSNGTVSLKSVAKELGLEFVHYNGMTGELLMPETLGSGIALLDFDQDGDQDIYVVQGSRLRPSLPYAASIIVPEDTTDLRDQLFRNNLKESGSLSFTNVTDQSGIDSRGYGFGAMITDVNNDAFPDVYVTNLVRNELYLNQKNGTFEEVSESYGLDDSSWGMAASFLDFNNDGFQDLYLANYLNYTVELNKSCQDQSGRIDYCGPLSYPSKSDKIFLNEKGERFRANESIFVGQAQSPKAGLGSASILTNSGIVVFVANDSHDNYFWEKNEQGNYRDAASVNGTAVNKFGEKEGSMGVAVGDFDSDLDEEIFVTHWKEETNTLYISGGNSYFDETASVRLALPSRNYTGFGTHWLDLDRSGSLDLIIVNGSIRKLVADHEEGNLYPLTERNQIFLNQDGRFHEIKDVPFVKEKNVSRALVKGDLDNDGDFDLLVSNNSGELELFINESFSERWIGFDLFNRAGARSSLHNVSISTDDKREILRSGRRDGSYLSSSDPRVIFYLKPGESIVDGGIKWADGSVTEIPAEKLRYNEFNVIRK